MSSDKENRIRNDKGFQSVAQSFSDTAKKLLGKNGFVELDIITNWKKIIGEKTARYVNPLTIDFKKGQRDKGILNLSVESGSFALEIGHKKNLIIEKINSYFGYIAVSDIKIFQTNQSANNKKISTQSTGKKKNLVTFEEQNYIVEQTAQVENKELRDILQKLGNNIFEQDEENENK